MSKGYQPVVTDSPNERQHRYTMARAVNDTIQGRINVVGEVTLTASVTRTTFKDPRIHNNRFIWLMPMTSRAKTALAGVYFDEPGTGQVVIHHARSAATDQDFRALIVG